MRTVPQRFEPNVRIFEPERYSDHRLAADDELRTSSGSSMKLAFLTLLSVGLGFSAWYAGPAGDSSSSDLRAIYDAHDWFKLREAIAGKDVPPLYKGAVAAAFDQTTDAEAALLPLINGSTSSKDADDADDWLSYLFVRRGQYQKAAAQMDEGTPLLHTLKTLPDQTVTRADPSSVSCRILRRRLFVPVTIQSNKTELFLDSDANFSFMSESLASNLGLTLQEGSVPVHGAGGMQSGFRTAVADDLAIGDISLKHVAFMVMPDDEDVFAGLQMTQQGAIGLPVLLALRNLHYNKGNLDLAQSSSKGGEQNLCFDGLDPLVRATFNQQQLPMILDTGAAMTEIWPPFAHQFPDALNASKTSTATENSFGGKSRVAERVLPDLMLTFAGCDVHIRPARVLMAQTTPNSRRYYGRLGLDALTSVRSFRLDFENFTFSIE